MKIGLLKEEKIPADSRVALTPQQCRLLKENYPNIQIVVMSSRIRCFPDQLYISEGIEIVHDLSDCDILIGIKEVPINSLIPNKVYLFFSHTIKEQSYNRELLLKMLDYNITMVDYEVLKNSKGKRVLGFGNYAGIVGAYNGLLTYGLKSRKFDLKPAYKCIDRTEMEGELKKINLNDEKIVITGNGRVGKGVLELMASANIKQVSKDEFLNNTFIEPVFVHLKTMDYNIRMDGKKSDKNDFYSNPLLYKSCLMDYLKHAEIFIAGHYYSANSPFLFTRHDARSSELNVKVVADISCDINGPVASTIRSSSISEPIYGYNPITEGEDDYMKENVIAVMAIDNLPCELPKDASEYFGRKMLEKVFPNLINQDNEDMIKNATICKDGNLTTNFEYLRDFISKN